MCSNRIKEKKYIWVQKQKRYYIWCGGTLARQRVKSQRKYTNTITQLHITWSCFIKKKKKVFISNLPMSLKILFVDSVKLTCLPYHQLGEQTISIWLSPEPMITRWSLNASGKEHNHISFTLMKNAHHWQATFKMAFVIITSYHISKVLHDNTNHNIQAYYKEFF